MNPSLASCWYPFRSKEVRAIYEHLTPVEATSLKQYSRKAGGVFGAIISLFMFPFFFYSVRYIQQPWGFPAVLAAAILLGLVLGVVLGAPLRKKAKQLLCDSAYAREKGYTPENLRLYSFEK